MTAKIQLLSVAALLAAATVAQAHCGECGTKGDKGDKTAAAATCEKGECDSCPIAAAMEKLPQLTYAVGDESVCCEMGAKTLAKKTGGHIHYVVGKKEFDSKADAQAALLEATEEFLVGFTEPHTCPASGKLTLAGRAQSCEKTAGHMAKLMNDAMSEVKLTYAVGDEECNCPIEAGKLAEKSGKDKQFVVGEEKTCCEQTARLNLARAKYKAAVEALVAAQAPSDKPEAEQGT